MARSRLLALVAAVALTAAACGDDDDTAAADTSAAGSSPETLAVVATTTQTADFTRVVGGDLVEVYEVIKPNVDAHDYEPTPADLEQLGAAALIVQNGAGLEEWFEDTIAQADASGVVVDASTGITLRQGGEHPGESDPHIWTNPANAKVMVTNIAAGLVQADPAHQTAYEANRDAYLTQIDALDAELRAQLDALPTKKLVTNHDALGYYVDYYGLQYVGSVIPSFDTATELSASDIEDLVAKIKAEGVKAIFTEASLPPDAAEALAQEAGVTVVSGDDALYADSLGPPGSDGDTYLKMMRHNTRVIVENLA
jgi:zinc/manganese transport system substrate-binding protein